MATVRLTKDADKLICLIYKAYLQRRKDGVSKGDAKYWGGSATIQKALCPDQLFDDVDETCRELDRAGFLECGYADNVVYHANLSDKAIIYMENRFKDGIVGVTSFLAKFIP